MCNMKNKTIGAKNRNAPYLEEVKQEWQIVPAYIRCGRLIERKCHL